MNSSTIWVAQQLRPPSTGLQALPMLKVQDPSLSTVHLETNFFRITVSALDVVLLLNSWGRTYRRLSESSKTRNGQGQLNRSRSMHPGLLDWSSNTFTYITAALLEPAEIGSRRFSSNCYCNDVQHTIRGCREQTKKTVTTRTSLSNSSFSSNYCLTLCSSQNGANTSSFFR